MNKMFSFTFDHPPLTIIVLICADADYRNSLAALRKTFDWKRSSKVRADGNAFAFVGSYILTLQQEERAMSFPAKAKAILERGSPLNSHSTN
ncbi:hypothetical protein Tco_0568829 [Tanacetum coccineum]